MIDDPPTCDHCEPIVNLLPNVSLWPVYGWEHESCCPEFVPPDNLMMGSIAVPDFSIGAIVEATADARSREQSALAMYLLAKQAGLTENNRILIYRCRAHRCLLLDVFLTVAGPAIYFPTTRFSPSANEKSAKAAKIERTTDGDRRWIDHADLMLDGANRQKYWLSCDHVRDHQVGGGEIREAMARHETEILVDG